MNKTKHFEQTNNILSADRFSLTFKSFKKRSPKMRPCKKNIWRIINTIASIWLQKYAQIFVPRHYLFLEAHGLLLGTNNETVRFSEQIMAGDKYPCIFSRQMEAIVYIMASSNSTMSCLIHYYLTQEWPTSNFSSQNKYFIKRNGYQN